MAYPRDGISSQVFLWTYNNYGLWGMWAGRASVRTLDFLCSNCRVCRSHVHFFGRTGYRAYLDVLDCICGGCSGTMEYQLQSVQAVTEFFESRVCQAGASTKLIR